MTVRKTKKIRSTCRFSAVFAAVFIAAFLSGPALATAPPFAPTPADPGGIMRDLETERRAPAARDQAVTVPRYEDPDLDLSTEKVFVLNGVVLDEGTVYDEDRLLSFYRDFLGEEVSFADLHRIARRITRKYREDGYVFSRVILPPQRIEDGVVRLQAIEGRITNVEIVGEYSDAAGLISRLAEKIPTAGPANTREIERYLLLIDDLPGSRARSIMRPSEERAGGELIITIEQNTFEGAVGIDNRGVSRQV
ncbi:MAG: ShlB/FhaC/HecB family hemolysin secretion/activation protein [Micavibrio sp.]|nr:MAG: ShlB/FhaC/HecB family hemolysin secretion/activation protein [Micavibrio sp.]